MIDHPLHTSRHKIVNILHIFPFFCLLFNQNLSQLVEEVLVRGVVEKSGKDAASWVEGEVMVEGEGGEACPGGEFY